MNRYGGPVFDCDTHVNETVENFNRHLPEPARSALDIRRVEEPGGRWPYYVHGVRSDIIAEMTRIGDRVPRPGSLKEFLHGIKTGNPDFVFIDPTPEIRTREGRLRWMDAGGIETALLYPGECVTLWPYIRDTRLKDAFFHAFNQYLDEDWGFNRDGRLYACPLMTLDNLDNAIAEVEWCIARGARLLLMPVGPVDGKSPAHPHFDPFWARVNEARMTVVFHIGESTGTQPLLRAWGEALTPARHLASAWFWMNAYGEQPLIHMLSSIVFHNFFARFPHIRIISAENGAEFVPKFLVKMDKSRGMAKGGTWPCGALKERPSRIFLEHVGVVAYPEDDVASIVSQVGSADFLLAGTDFPHPEGVAGPQAFVEGACAGVGEADLAKIMYGNARRLLRLRT
ncbi:MAG: amidohydrolase family protein [Gammaproteobacteria bacterium]